MSWEYALSLLAMTAAHTFWLFYVSGDIPGTLEHQLRKERKQASDGVGA